MGLPRSARNDNMGLPRSARNDEEIEIPVRFHRNADGTIGFAAESYDPEKELIIDPLVYSTFIGGDSNDEAFSIVLDDLNNAYVAGITRSFDYPITVGAYDNSYGGGLYDAFITKINSTGTDLVYSTYIGGGKLDICQGLAIDGLNNAHIVGFTESSTFPTTNGAFDETYNGGGDVFVTKLELTAEEPVGKISINGHDFGTYPIGQEKRSNVILQNKGDKTLEIDSIVTSSAEFVVISSPERIQPEASEPVTIAFTPSKPGVITATITAYCGNDTASALIKGTGIEKPNDSTAVLELSITPNHGKPGDRVKLVLRLIDEKNLPEDAIDYEALEIGLNSNVLFFDNSLTSVFPQLTKVNQIKMQSQNGNIEIAGLEIEGARRPGNDTLCTIDLNVHLGDEDTTKIYFMSNFVLSNTTMPVYTTLKDSIFIVDVCRANGEPRLIMLKDDESFISKVKPNPIDNQAGIEYFIHDKGNVTFSIVSIYGEEDVKATRNYKEKGTDSAIIDTSDLISGVYMIVMKHDGRVVDKRQIIIVR